MPRYRFSWENLDRVLTRALVADLQLQGDPADALRSAYGARPRADFVRDAWPTLLSAWLGRDRPSTRRIAQRCRERGVGSLDERDDLVYLAGLRNTTGLRDIVLDLFIALGEQSSDDRAAVHAMSTSVAPPAANNVDETPTPAAPAAPAAPEPAQGAEPEAAAGDDVEGLRRFVGDAIVELTGGPVMVDDDGDFVLPSGSAVVYVSIVTEPLYIRVFSVMLREVAERPEVFRLMNSVNMTLRIGRLVYVNGAVLLEHHLLPIGLSGGELQIVVDCIRSAADYFDHRLQGEIGGSTTFAERAEDEIDV